MSLVDRSRKAIVLAAGTRNLLSDEDTFFGMLAQERFCENTPDFIQLVHNHKRFLSKFHICVFNVKKWFWLLKPFLHTIWICKKLTSSTPVSVWRLHHQDQGKDCQRAKGKNVVEPPDSNLGVCDTESAAGIRGYFLPLGSGKQERRPRQPG